VRLAAALASAVTAYFAVGLVAGCAPTLRRSAGTRRRAAAAQLWLTQAGVALSPAQFWTGSATVALAAFALLTAVTATPAVALVPAVAVGLLPRAYFARRRGLRLAEVAQAWPDGLRELVAAVSAGMSLPQAVSGLAAAGPPPLQRAFSRFPLLLRMLGFVPALEVVKAELADPTSDRVIEVLVLAHERGGRIVGEILRDLAEAAAADAKTCAEIATAGLEQKLNARSVFVLPWVVLALLTARPGHFRDFYQSAGGVGVVVVAAVLSAVGMGIVARLARDPVEERVLADGGAVR